MRTVFADTFYFLAMTNPKDRAHAAARAYTAGMIDALVTTAWVLTEVADALCDPRHRPQFLTLLATLRGSATVTILPPDAVLFDDGLRLYAARADKAWPLTDCISFAVMQRAGITHALTGDRHFVQAGFTIEFP
jgi:predicted nucleic acid-binding protein